MPGGSSSSPAPAAGSSSAPRRFVSSLKGEASSRARAAARTAAADAARDAKAALRNDLEAAEVKSNVVKVMAATDKQSRRRRCVQLVQSILWGKDGAKDYELKAAIVMGLEVLFLALVVADLLTGGWLHQFGVHPREVPLGLIGVLFAPFLHRNLWHLLVNAVPFAVLSMLVLLRREGIRLYAVLSVTTAIVAGLLVWSLAPSHSNHIGSSGLIFSYFGFLLISGVLLKSLRETIVAALVFLMYSSIFWGVLPVDEKVSWETHLFSLLCGAAFALLMHSPFGRAVYGDAADNDDADKSPSPAGSSDVTRADRDAADEEEREAFLGY